jgi:phage tail sheath protein FI
MPEYLAPGVYVEEVDTGPKPIEGVSTSTTGAVGVTERGPIDVPILVTSTGEFQRWFGGRLRDDDYPPIPGLKYMPTTLPHAVEGFFTNGGKRLFVVRVVSESAVPSETYVFRGDTPATAETRLAVNAAAGQPLVLLANSGIAKDDWLRIGTGSEAEYLQAADINHAVVLDRPLAADYAPGSTVEVLNPNPPANGAPKDLAEDAKAGDKTLTLNDATGLALNKLVTVGTGDEEEYGFIKSIDVANKQITLAFPVARAHAKAGSVQLRDDGTAATPTTVAAPSAKTGDVVLMVADATNYTTAGTVVRVTAGTTREVLKVRAGLARTATTIGAYADYAAGSDAIKVTRADDALTATTVAQDAPAGAVVLDLAARTGYADGDVIRLGADADADVEYLVIKTLPNRSSTSPDAGKTVLAAPTRRPHAKGAEVVRQTITPSGSAVKLALNAPLNAAELITPTGSFAAGEYVQVTASGQHFFHKVATASATLTPLGVQLNKNLSRPHLAGSAVQSRTPMLLVRALDVGGWGNRLRVIADGDTPLVKARIAAGGVPDSTHLKLTSLVGVEEGTILRRPGETGKEIKVGAVDRKTGTITSDAALPAGLADGDAIESVEFQLTVRLLAAPDPAFPGREKVADAEVFRSLSMDPRHSRYVHKVLGTIWDAGATADKDGNSLRLVDRRSRGESRYVRVFDVGTATDKTVVRLGPEILTDTLPDGRVVPAALPLAGGDDSLATFTQDRLKGIDDPEPTTRTGIQSLQNEDDISIVACPGVTEQAVQQALIDHCEFMRYRFAVLDGPPPPADSLTDVRDQRQQFDTKYAALYHPWLLIPEPFPANPSAPIDYPIPPSGHMAGIYANTDVTRGVHKAPANEVLRGIVGLRRSLKKGEQDLLNPFPVNINVIRDFRNDSRGLRVWGARVITSDPDWKYVNVRRLFIFVEKSIERGLQWVVFEPNAEPLWARVRRSVSAFLNRVWRDGALEGTTAEQAYFVKVDRTTMTQNDIDNGRLIIQVGIAPVKPAEFVIIRIGLFTANAQD